MASLMADPGEKALATLLSTLTATLEPSTYVFTTFKNNDVDTPPLSETQMLFRESEGITVITTLDYATEHALEYFFPSRMISLNVTSSLEAVGFMAVIASRLATKGMGVNPVSGFYHDHLFVPLGREAEALEVLAELAQEYQQRA